MKLHVYKVRINGRWVALLPVSTTVSTSHKPPAEVAWWGYREGSKNEAA